MFAFLFHCCCKNDEPIYTLSIVNAWIQYNDDDYVANGLLMYRYVTTAYFGNSEIASFSTAAFYVYPSSYGLYGYRDDNGDPVAPYQEYTDEFDPQIDTLEGKMQTFLSTIKDYLQSNNVPYSATIRANFLDSSEPEFKGEFSDFINDKFIPAISDKIEDSKKVSDNQDKDYRFSQDKSSCVIKF